MNDIKLLMLGSGGVGKSSVSIRFVSQKFVDQYDPTIEDSYKKVYEVDGQEETLHILDTSGQEEYEAMRDTYVRSAEGYILVYSITNKGSYEEMASFWDKISRVKKNAPVVLVANKSDLSKQRAVTTAEGESLAASWSENVKFIESSAKTGTNVDEIFNVIVRAVREARLAKKKKPKKSSSGKKKGNCTIL